MHLSGYSVPPTARYVRGYSVPPLAKGWHAFGRCWPGLSPQRALFRVLPSSTQAFRPAMFNYTTYGPARGLRTRRTPAGHRVARHLRRRLWPAAYL